MEWQPIETAPIGKEMFVAVAVGVSFSTISNYRSDPYVVWQPIAGKFSRWPHDKFNPTHWIPLPEPPEDHKKQPSNDD